MCACSPSQPAADDRGLVVCRLVNLGQRPISFKPRQISDSQKEEEPMKYTTLGNTGLLVSKLCLGTMTFGDGRGMYKAIGAVGQAAADELVRTSIESGINFFDTADVYTEG